ncbi:MAG: Tellurite resistance protein TehA [Pseudomonadota bacterium]|jgi:tellurite resistance protein
MRTFLSAPPVSAFAMVMGLSGLSLAWTKFSHVVQLSYAQHFALVFGLLALFVFIVLALGLIRKQIETPEVLSEEWGHPVKSSFFGAISVGICLLSAVVYTYSPTVAEFVWIFGALLHLLVMLAVLNAWVHRDTMQASQACPVWFIPAVGNVVIPLGGVKLGYIEISWFFFGVGLIFWLVLLSLVMYRLMFVQPALPDRLKPTMAIFLAPPTLAFSAWIALTSQNGSEPLDPTGHLLIAIGFFFAFFLITQFKKFAKLPFFMSWWAYSFPSASFTIAAFNYALFTPESIYVAYASLVFTTVLILGLFIRTLMAIHMRDPHWVD